MDSLGDGLRLRGLVDVVEQDGEFVGRGPRERIALAQAGLQPLRHLDEDLVTGRVPEALVQRLEAVDVDEQHCQPVALAAPCVPKRALDQVEELRPVG